jgi:hypothetical protein
MMTAMVTFQATAIFKRISMGLPVVKGKGHRWSAMITGCIVADKGTASDHRTDADGHPFPAMLLL